MACTTDFGNSFEQKNNLGTWWFPRTVKLIKPHVHTYGDKGWFFSPDTIVLGGFVAMKYFDRLAASMRCPKLSEWDRK